MFGENKQSNSYCVLSVAAKQKMLSPRCVSDVTDHVIATLKTRGSSGLGRIGPFVMPGDDAVEISVMLDEEIKGSFRPRFCILRLYWAGDNETVDISVMLVEEMTLMLFQTMILYYKAILGRGQHVLIR